MKHRTSTRRIAPSILSLAALLALPAGCFTPDIPDKAFKCDEAAGKGCPPGFSCVLGKCAKDGKHIDLASPDSRTDRAAGKDVSTEGSAIDHGNERPPVEEWRVDGATSDLAAADSGVPDAPASLDSRSPDRSQPDKGAPDLAAPDTAQVPDLRAPDLRAPDLRAPDLRAPDLRAPDLRAPDLQVADLAGPDAGSVYCPAGPVPLEVSTPLEPSRFGLSVGADGRIHVIAADEANTLQHLVLDHGNLTTSTVMLGNSLAASTKAAIAIGPIGPSDPRDRLHVTFANASVQGELYYTRFNTGASAWSDTRRILAGYALLADKMVDIDATAETVAGVGATARAGGGFAFYTFEVLNDTAAFSCSFYTPSLWFETVRIGAGKQYYAVSEARQTASGTGGAVNLWRFPKNKACNTTQGATYTTLGTFGTPVPVAIQLDPRDDNAVHAAYVDANAKSLHYVAWDGSQGGTPNDSSPVSGGVTASSVDLQVDETGNPHILYQATTTQGEERLKLLSKSAGGWSNPTLATAVGRYARLHYDRATRTLHAVYTDAAGKLAYSCHRP